MDEIVDDEEEKAENKMPKYKIYFGIITCIIIALLFIVVIVMVFGVKKESEYIDGKKPDDFD